MIGFNGLMNEENLKLWINHLKILIKVFQELFFHKLLNEKKGLFIKELIEILREKSSLDSNINSITTVLMSSWISYFEFLYLQSG